MTPKETSDVEGLTKGVNSGGRDKWGAEVLIFSGGDFVGIIVIATLQLQSKLFYLIL